MIDKKSATEYLSEYWGTYDRQHDYEEYSDDTFLDDALYGIGAAIDDKYKFADGYGRFKEFLRERLNEPR